MFVIYSKRIEKKQELGFPTSAAHAYFHAYLTTPSWLETRPWLRNLWTSSHLPRQFLGIWPAWKRPSLRQTVDGSVTIFVSCGEPLTPSPDRSRGATRSVKAAEGEIAVGVEMRRVGRRLAGERRRDDSVLENVQPFGIEENRGYWCFLNAHGIQT